MPACIIFQHQIPNSVLASSRTISPGCFSPLICPQDSYQPVEPLTSCSKPPLPSPHCQAPAGRTTFLHVRPWARSPSDPVSGRFGPVRLLRILEYGSKCGLLDRTLPACFRLSGSSEIQTTAGISRTSSLTRQSASDLRSAASRVVGSGQRREAPSRCAAGGTTHSGSSAG